MVQPFQRPRIVRKIRQLIAEGFGSFDEEIYHSILDEVDWVLEENEIYNQVKQKIVERGGSFQVQEQVDMIVSYDKQIERLQNKVDRLKGEKEKLETKLEKAYDVTGKKRLRQELERLKVQLAVTQTQLEQLKAWRDDEKRKKALYYGDIG